MVSNRAEFHFCILEEVAQSFEKGMGKSRPSGCALGTIRAVNGAL